MLNQQQGETDKQIEIFKVKKINQEPTSCPR